MSFSGKIYIDESVHCQYVQYADRNENGMNTPFLTMKDLFLCSAIFGASHSCCAPLKKPRDIFGVETFSHLDHVVLYAVAHKVLKTLDELADSRQVLNVVQEYANGGLNLLIPALLDSPGSTMVEKLTFLMMECNVPAFDSVDRKVS